MTSTTSNRSQPISFKETTHANDTGFDFPLSPSEAGKFDFYRVHLTNQGQLKDANHYETPDSSNIITDVNKRWSPFAHLKHLSDETKGSPLRTSAASASLLQTATDSDGSSINNKTLNKPIQTVASFSSLTDAVKNAMHRGYISANQNQLRRTENGSSVSKKDLNHLSPQSM